ncbi:MAG TPA: sugar ABC transporter permease [Clostridia bacterium]|nr:sugar ABC transporter permease [Clostridia bacterium]
MNSPLYRKKWPLLIFLLPAFSFLAVFLFYPFVQNILNSFLNISGLGTAAAGFNEPWYHDYIKMHSDPNMATALKNSLIMTGATIVFQVGLALLLALLVDRIKLGAKLFRTIYFFPIVISATALGLLFNLIFLYNGGMLNQLFASLFNTAGNLDFKSEKYFLATMLTPVMWQYVGFYFVIFVTGLNNISSEVYEAAELDGAEGLKRTFYITLPLLRNVLCTCLVLGITGALKVFDLPWVMMGEGIPMDKSWLLGTYMYSQAFNRGDVDYASAIAVLIVILGVIFALVSNKLFKQKDY